MEWHRPSLSSMPFVLVYTHANRVYMCTCRIYVCVCVCGCMHIHIHTYKQTYIHTYMHTYIHIQTTSALRRLMTGSSIRAMWNGLASCYPCVSVCCVPCVYNLCNTHIHTHTQTKAHIPTPTPTHTESHNTRALGFQLELFKVFTRCSQGVHGPQDQGPQDSQFRWLDLGMASTAPHATKHTHTQPTLFLLFRNPSLNQTPPHSHTLTNVVPVICNQHSRCELLNPVNLNYFQPKP